MIEVFAHTINAWFIKSLVSTVLLIIFVKYLWKKYDLTLTIWILRSLILFYSITAIIIFLIEFSGITDINSNQTFSYQRSTGPYSFYYILMLTGHLLLPLLLLIKRFKNNLYLILAIAFLMNLGRIFESFVIIVTSLHQEYLVFYPRRELKTIGQGFAVGVILIIVPFLFHQIKERFFKR